MRTLMRAGVVAVVLASLGVPAVLASLGVPAVLASPYHPKGEFADFAYCPLKRKKIANCIYALSDGGSIKIGEKVVPIASPVLLQGGFEGSGEEIKFFGAEGGETLSAAPQEVPGGLAVITAPSWWPESLKEWFDEEIQAGGGAVRATLELAAPAASIELDTENLINAEGVALGLPVRIKLENPLLGSNCYLGSRSDPIRIDFTSGTSGATHGSRGAASFNKANTRITLSGGRVVNGAFAVPRADGCGGLLSYFIDPLVDTALGLPSASGQNTAMLEGDFESAVAFAVRKSE